MKNGGWPDAYAMASLPEMRKAQIAAALVKVVSCVKRPGHPHGEYRTQNLAYAASMGQLAYYRLLASQAEAAILDTREAFASHVDAWSNATDYSELPVGFVIGMEGADAIVWPEQVHEWWDNGLRVVSLPTTVSARTLTAPPRAPTAASSHPQSRCSKRWTSSA